MLSLNSSTVDAMQTPLMNAALLLQLCASAGAFVQPSRRALGATPTSYRRRAARQLRRPPRARQLQPPRATPDAGDEHGDAPLVLGVDPRAAAEWLADPRYEVFSSLVTLTACFLFAVSTLDLPDDVERLLVSSENGLSVFFAAEYALRWIARGLDPRFVVEFLSIVDAVSLLPTFVSALTDVSVPTALYVLRLLRFLRLQRLLKDVESFSKFRAALGVERSLSSGDRMQDAVLLQLARVLSTLLTLLFVSSGLIYAAETGVNDQLPDYFTCLYFGLTTLTTVGFGDIVPVTPAGRAVVSASTLFGIAIVPVQLTSLADTVLKTQRAREAKAVAKPRGIRLDRLTRACSNCSEKAHRKDANFCWQCGVPLPDAEPLPDD